MSSRAEVVWLTGLSGAGKSTLAEALAAALRAHGETVAVLDGDVLRQGLCSDLGFSPEDRVENIRRTAEVARLMQQAGLRVIVALISPYAAERAAAQARFAPGEFIEVHVHAPLSVAEARDPKGLYARARRGEIRQFTGIDAPYEAPATPALRIDTSRCNVTEAVTQLLNLLRPAD
ncbi:adenylyl-sulfate kinase [Roseateles asaccharophilus]|uniref:Adenylyl-sulfate kinase n=1 Tax=Roseateles asaccharophilus TaxID=582607 RepID=A0ABU2ABW5_9BURK|nr:adenylyl-sulfate kinase [Roseateles asaccharophilus]MDR7334697.1 adenylyl-sulfate kinase [Roseateles asaccharophilus]